MELPRESHGDLATNIAMVTAKSAGMNPRALAELYVAKLAALDDVQSAEIAGPGFINLRLPAQLGKANCAISMKQARPMANLELGKAKRSMLNLCQLIPQAPFMLPMPEGRFSVMR